MRPSLWRSGWVADASSSECFQFLPQDGLTGLMRNVAFIQGEHRQLSKAIETMQNPLFCVNSVYLELAILQDFAENMIES